VTKYKPIKLPKDGNAHKNIIEWWYFNGHLKDKRGKRYSFMDCLFQADLKRVNLPFLRKIPFHKYAANFLPYVYFAHSIVSDISAQKSYKEVQNISLVSRDSFTKPFLFANYIDPLIYKGYTNSEIAQTNVDTFHIKTEKLDLELTAKKPVLLEQGNGFIDVCGRKSFYYSYTDLRAKGILTLDGKRIEVDGKAWMDHQWADVAYGKDKWTWFSIQLEDGTDIMLAEYDDKMKCDYLVDIIHADGSTEHFSRVNFRPTKDKNIFSEVRKPKQNIHLSGKSRSPTKTSLSTFAPP
jgi:predicted secreted hydrolase